MTEPLQTCPRCGRTGYYAAGLRAHVCHGRQPGAERRRLTPDELREAATAATPFRPMPNLGTTPTANTAPAVEPTHAGVAAHREGAGEGMRETPFHSSPLTLPSSMTQPTTIPEHTLAMTPAKRQARALLASEQLAAHDAAAVEQLKHTALRQLGAVQQLSQQHAAGCVLCGLTLHRVKASLQRGEFEPWMDSIRAEKSTTGGLLPSRSMRFYYMKLATVFVERTGTLLPHLLALPGDQFGLEIPDSDAGRELAEKLTAFVGDQSLNDLFDRYKIKERQVPQGIAAKGGRLAAYTPPQEASPLEAQEYAQQSARDWHQQNLPFFHQHWMVDHDYQHLPDVATRDGELTLDQFERLITDVLHGVQAERASRARSAVRKTA